jgi:hypothetical protein
MDRLWQGFQMMVGAEIAAIATAAVILAVFYILKREKPDL